MATITALESGTVSRGIAAAKQALALLEEIEQLQVIYDGAGGVKTTLTQAKLDDPENAEFTAAVSGLTKAQLDDGMYALTSAALTALAGAKVQLITLASRGS